MKSDRPDEALAEYLVEAALGIAVRHLPETGPPRRVDAEILYPSGARGVLEVTQVGSFTRNALLAALQREGWAWPTSGAWRWTLHVSRASELKRLRAVVPRAIALCESQNITDPSYLFGPVMTCDPELRWLAWGSDVQLTGLPAVHLPPPIDLLPRGFGAAVPDTWIGIDDVLQAVLRSERVPDHIEKLSACLDADERHLFLIVTNEAIGNEWYLKLVGTDMAPDVLCTLPAGIDALWFATGARWVLCLRSGGWTRYETPSLLLAGSDE